VISPPDLLLTRRFRALHPQYNMAPSPDLCSKPASRDVPVFQLFVGTVKRKRDLEDTKKGLPRIEHWSN